jgi:hypothetical protein
MSSGDYACVYARIRHWRKCPCKECQDYANEIEKENELRLEGLRKMTEKTPQESK